jgi:hypothetical protein
MAAFIQVVTQGVEHVLVDGFTRRERQRAHGLAYFAREPDRELLDGSPPAHSLDDERGIDDHLARQPRVDVPRSSG